MNTPDRAGLSLKDGKAETKPLSVFFFGGRASQEALKLV